MIKSIIVFLIFCYLIGVAYSETLTAPMYGSIPSGPDSNPSVQNWGNPNQNIDQNLRDLCARIEGTPEAKDNGIAAACAAMHRTY